MDEEIQAAARREFDDKIKDLRQDLHRYCARMVGSSIDGEDVVQEALAKGYYQCSELGEVADLRAWLFRVAHNKSIDHLRRYDVRMGEPLVNEIPSPEEGDPLEQSTLAELGLAYFTKLTTLQRAAVIMKDVLGYSLAEISEVLDASVPAIKGALNRGRSSLRRLAATHEEDAPPVLSESETRLLTRYVERFNAQDFDALRGMLAEDVRLDLVGRHKARGAQPVGGYFTNYAKVPTFETHLELVEGRTALIVDDRPDGPEPYVILIGGEDGCVTTIRDYRYARHVLREADAASPLTLPRTP